MKVVINIDGKVYTGMAEVKKNADDTISVDVEDLAFIIDADPDAEVNRIFEDYQLLGWKE